MSKLVKIEFATGLEISPVADIPSGYTWTTIAVDAGEVGSVIESAPDKNISTQTCEVFLKGQKPNKDGQLAGRIVKGSLDELLKLFNDAR